MEIDTQVKLQQVGLAIAQGALLVACVIVSSPAVLLTSLASLLGRASEGVRMAREDKEDGNHIDTASAKSIFLSAIDIAGRSLVGAPLVKAEAVALRSEEADSGHQEEIVKTTAEIVTHDEIGIFERGDSDLPDEDSEASKS